MKATLPAAAMGILLAAGCALQQEAYFDLVRSADLAEAAVMPAVIDFGTPAARGYLGAGWSTQDELWAGEWSFAWATEETSSLRFHSFDDRLRALRFSCRPGPSTDGAPQTVTLVLNGVDLGTTTLAAGRATYRVKVPQGALRAGENTLEMRYAFRTARTATDTRRRAVAWDWLRFVGSEPAVPAPGGAADGDLAIPLGTRLDYYVDIRPGSTLVLGSSGQMNHPDSRLLVQMLDSAQRRDSREYSGRELAQGVEFSIAATGPTRVSLRVAADPGERGMRVRRARLRAPVQTSPPDPGRADTPIASGRPPNIIVYVVDTLRADHLGTYGYERPTSPHLDEFAGDSVVFERGYAHSGWTRTSVATLLSGLNPLVHGVLDREHPLPAATITLPALMTDSGYETVGIVTNGNLAPAFGFDNGFATYRYLAERDVRDYPEVHRLADEVNTEFFGWLDQWTGERPFFAYLHTTDPHSPYVPRSPYRERFLGDGSVSGVVWPRYAERFLAGQDAITEQELRDELVNLYDAEIAFNDEHFGRLLHELRARGLYEETAIVFTSDHGEEFLDHGEYAHGRTLYRELIRVPFVVRLPGMARGGRRSAATARQLDLLPTLLELVGGAVPDWAQGRSLLPAFLDPTWTETVPVRAYLQLDSNSAASLVDGDWHLLRTPMQSEYARTLSLELYDVAADPAEQQNLRAVRLAQAGLLLAGWRRLEANETPLFEAGSAEIDAELAARLRDLGYIR